jgi:hypothetical protein
LVASIAGEGPMMAQWDSFWKTNLKDGEALFRQALLSHIITARHAAPLMIRRRRGLIVEVMENDLLMAGEPPGANREVGAEGARLQHGGRADAARCCGDRDHARLSPRGGDAGTSRGH